MPSLHVAAWVAVTVTGGVLAAFVAVEGCRYLLRGRHLARLAREFQVGTASAPSPGVPSGAPRAESPGVRSFPHRPGPIARRPAIPPPGAAVVDGPE